MAVNQGKVFHYLVKPWQPEELARVVDKAFEHNLLLRDRRALTEELRMANSELEAKVNASSPVPQPMSTSWLPGVKMMSSQRHISRRMSWMSALLPRGPS
jgi:response regulator RpfG family c-di-GMP phosphodiesterase